MMRNHLPASVPGSDVPRILAHAGLMSQAVAELIRQGYDPISFNADVVSPGLPTILVASDRATAHAIENERAAYYMTSTVHGVPERWGQLLRPPPGVKVIWCERGH